MPIYAYRCAACGHSRDVLQKLSDAPLTVCPACGAEQFAKQLTAAGFQLKGSGWYATDFRHNGGGSGAPAGKPAAGAAEGGGSSASSGGDSAAAAPSTPCGGSCACH
ncbi:FmdB family zinc ribbon protein [Ideonella sp.]|uniref:FmdB family zinc ribbon protein n=1 Tax=Ideonella sp. TaxID=1929293 RepID=UPI0035AEC3F5